LGVDWERKGGNIVMETFEALKQRGMKVQLIISGCKPSISCDGVTILPFINKNTDAGLKQFDELFKKSHFMFVPTRAECFGMVFCEASAYGMPVISTDTGGVPGAVENGINGYLLPISANGNDYADVIQDCFLDETKYRALCNSSRKWFDNKLNRKTIITSMMQLYYNKHQL
jgi:glycosyltransferase involved in cell wall biosynthesis